MFPEQIHQILKEKLNFTTEDIDKLAKFHDLLLENNKSYNFISKSTEKDIWHRHIYDSAQLVKFINFKVNSSLVDLGSGGGFPGLVLSIFNKNKNFHVKLYEKSSVKSDFLENVINKLDLTALCCGSIAKDEIIEAEYLVSRAFKKLPEIMRISRENINKNHKLIILKGKNAQEEINKLPEMEKHRYTLYNSMTEENSKIIVAEIDKKLK
jgi:16S rRNA (guanine527-N7)-methyltransferase